MRDIEPILGDPTESLAAEAVMKFRYDNQESPTWADLAEALFAFPDVVEAEEVDPRIMCGWHSGEILARMDDDFDVRFDIAADTEKRLAARYAYGRLMLAKERPSPGADDIIAEGSIGEFQEAYGTPVVDWLAADLDITPEEALRILLADKDEHSDSITGETYVLAGTLHRFLSEHQSA